MLLEPAWSDVEDPVEKVFALLAQYRRAIVDTECQYGCPIGSLALELHDADPVVRERWRRISRPGSMRWRLLPGCRLALSQGTDFRGLAELALNVMEGGVMQSRTYRDVAHFDRAVAQFRIAVDAMRARETAA